MVAAILLSAMLIQAEPIAGFLPRQDNPHADRLRPGRRLRHLRPAGGRVPAPAFPGKPTIMAQNMPGAGIRGRKYIAEVAPKDGTVFGSLPQTLALDSRRTRKPSSTRQMPYIGRLVTNIDVGAALPRTGIKSFEDVRAQTIQVGASGGGSTTVLFRRRSTPMPERSSKSSGATGGPTKSCWRWKEPRSISSGLRPSRHLVSHPGWVHGARRQFLSGRAEAPPRPAKRPSHSGARAVRRGP